MNSSTSQPTPGVPAAAAMPRKKAIDYFHNDAAMPRKNTIDYFHNNSESEDDLESKPTSGVFQLQRRCPVKTTTSMTNMAQMMTGTRRRTTEIVQPLLKTTFTRSPQESNRETSN